MIKRLSLDQENDIRSTAKILSDVFPWSYGEEYRAIDEVKRLCEDDGIAYVYVVDETVKGIVGAKPQYGSTGWELHPLAVDKDYRHQGIAKTLMSKIEAAVVDKGGIVLYLGSDDEHFRTSLSSIDLFEDPLEAIKNIRNYSDHPFTFYEKIGYKIVGVLPDANGWNKPDIYMAKRLVKRPLNGDGKP